MANYYCQPTSLAEILQALEFCKEEAIPYMVRGMGTRSFIDKSGYPGMVISMRHFCGFEMFDPEDADRELDRSEIEIGQHIGVRFNAGISTLDITRNFRLAGLNGLEFLSGFNNSLGSIIIRNCGGFFENLSAHKLEIMYIDKDLNIKIKSWKEIKYEYYNSSFYGNSIIIMLELELGRIEQDNYFKNIMTYVESNPYYELSKHGLGPIFKPLPGEELKHLFSKCNLAGLEIGGCYWNKLNENFIHKSGNPSSNDVLALMLEAKNRIRDQFSITLEPRVDYYGPKSNISSELYGTNYPFTIDPVYYQMFDHNGE